MRALVLVAPLLLAAGTGPAQAPGTVPGVIEGVLRVPPAPTRRVAQRYPGMGAGPARTVQEIEPLVYLRGSVAGAPAPPARDGAMAQKDTAFTPSLLVVPRGATVEFPNRDSFFHNVFSYSAVARFDLGRYPKGESKSVTFDEPGVAKIYCEVHDFMRAAVIVVENPFHAVPDDEGRFRIRGVPPGTYTLVAWHPDQGTAEREVTVPDGGTARVELDLS